MVGVDTDDRYSELNQSFCGLILKPPNKCEVGMERDELFARQRAGFADGRDLFRTGHDATVVINRNKLVGRPDSAKHIGGSGAKAEDALWWFGEGRRGDE